MIIRVPLLHQKSYAVLRRLDITGTAAAEPYAGAISGYDPDFREPIPYDNTLVGGDVERALGRIELAEIRVPCQVETVQVEDLQQFPAGDSPNSNIRLVFHTMDLNRLSLINAANNKPLIAINDRLVRLESITPGSISYPFEDPGLYIFAMIPASFGFGPIGYDLWLAYLHDRVRAVSR
jgi:hypothetical protein